MKVRFLFCVLSLLLLALPLLAGCKAKEEPKPAGYYEGPRDPKGGSPAAAAGGKMDPK